MSYNKQKKLIKLKLERQKIKEIIQRHEFIGELIEQHGGTAKGRKELARKSFFAFCMIYLPHIFSKAPADFHHLLIHELQFPSDPVTGVMGFRGSGKSTISSFAFPLWAAITQKYEFLMCIYSDRDAMTLSIGDMKREVEDNSRLRNDFNINIQKKVQGITEKWSDNVLTFNKRKNIIVGKTVGQKVRGYKYAGKRPQFILLDDAENPQNSDKRANRQKFQKYFYGEVIPGKDEKFQIVIVGNLTHRACLLEVMEKNGGTVFKFPLIKNGKIQWKARYQDMKAIEEEKKMIMMGEFGKQIWAREYMLKIVDDESAIVKQKDIHYYEEDQYETALTLMVSTGIDLAISEKQTADYTAFVTAHLMKTKFTDEYKIFISPKFVHKRMGFIKTMEKAIEHYDTLPLGNKFNVEKVQYQQAAIETMKRNGINVQGVPATSSKSARLSAIAHYISNGTVLFHKDCAIIISELLDFGVAEHDDLVDALVYAIQGLLPSLKQHLGVEVV